MRSSTSRRTRRRTSSSSTSSASSSGTAQRVTRQQVIETCTAVIALTGALLAILPILLTRCGRDAEPARALVCPIGTTRGQYLLDLPETPTRP